MSATDAPILPAELDRWHETLVTRELCDKAAGKTDQATVNARAAYKAAANGRAS